MTQITDIRLWTALVTPFTTSGEIDVTAFDNHLDRQAAARVRGWLLFGSTGEAATLSDDEKALLLDRACQRRGDALLMVGTTHNDTRVAVAWAREAEAGGADVLLVAPPYYNKPSQAGILAHFRAIHDAVRIPIVAYNIPSRVGVDISVDTLREMAPWPRLGGLKEASGNQLLAAVGVQAGLTVWSGDDPTVLPYMSLGAIGGISVNSNLFPAEYLALIEAYARGDHATALTLADRFTDWYYTVFAEVNPVGIKTALACRGWMEATVRLPLVAMSTQNATRIRDYLSLTS